MNTYFTKNPIVGTPLTPSVIKQINTAVRRYMPIAGPGIRTSVTAGGTIISAIPAPAPKKQKDKPLPFEVRYDGTLDDGAGGWKIYLPTEHLVQFDGAYLDPLNGVTPILDANGDETGWYSFDEITLEDDHVWLVISATASFANAEDQQAVANICIAEVSYGEQEDGEQEDGGGTPTVEIKQSVVGAIVMSSGGEDHDTHYYADDKSIENAKFSGSGSSHVVESNTFALKGFGRFDRDQTGEAGIFVGSTELELGSEAMTGASVLVRQGDTDTVNGNTLGFVRLKLPEGSNAATPFQYVEVPDPEQEGQTLFKIVNCFFYFGGQPHTLPDFANIPATGTVYLTCVKESSQASSWQFAVAAAPAQAPSGGSAINIKLYDFQNGKVTMDYRTTFLTLGEGGNTVEPDDVSTEFIPEPPSGSTPTGDEGKLQIKGFKSGQPADTNTIAEYLMGTAQTSGQIWLIVRGESTGGDPVLGYLPLDALNLYEYAKKTDLPAAPGDGTLTIKHGSTTLGTFTANQATPATVTIPEPPTPPTVNDGTLTLNLGSLSKTFSANQAANETITVPAKTIVAGSNVAISVSGNTLTISATGGGSTSGFTGTRRTLALTRYDISTNQLQAKFFTETWANGLMTASVIDDEWSVIEGGQAVVETV